MAAGFTLPTVVEVADEDCCAICGEPFSVGQVAYQIVRVGETAPELLDRYCCSPECRDAFAG